MDGISFERRSFERLGDAVPASPVVVSVPHAGRDYPAALIAALRVRMPVAAALEDRYVDAVALAARRARTTIVAHRARAWIDLNRSEDDRDAAVDDGARAMPPVASAKVRSGLGLVPRLAGRTEVLWHRRFSADEVMARIVEDHRPYHAAIAAALAAARARFGIAVLLDLHSMPSLGAGNPRIVIGDRLGKAASRRFVAQAQAAAGAHRTAINAPYAGGHILARHGDPARAIHAIQLELDRTLYLDSSLDRPGAGFAATVALVARLLDRLEDEAMAGRTLAAECHA